MIPWSIEPAVDVRPAALEWLWPGYLPRGKLVLLDGDPEMGKSLLTIDLIARLSRGRPLPDGTPLPRAFTGILLSAEDDPSDTIRPRLEAAGADLSRVLVPKFDGRAPRFPEDLVALEQLVVEHSADLVVMDPLMAFLPPGVAANVDQCVRQVLTPLGKMAGWTGCLVMMVRHLTKVWQARALMRGQGSVGIAAAVRTGLFVGPHPEEAGGRVLAVAKTNVGVRPPALGFRVAGSPGGPPVVEWTGPVGVTADALGQRKRDAGLKVRDRAVDWLRRELAGGPRRAADVYAAAAAAGIPDRTLERAKERLRAKSHREYDYKARQGEWWWYDPDAPWPKKAPFERPAESPPLPDLPGLRGW